MLPANSVSERLVQLKEEMRELTDAALRYRAKGHRHTDLEKTAHARRQEQLLMIKQKLANMMKRGE